MSYPDYPDIGTYDWTVSGTWTANGNKLTLSESKTDDYTTVDSDNQVTLRHAPYTGRTAIEMTMIIEEAPEQTTFEGTYTAKTEKSAMGNPVTYDSEVTFNLDGTFVYNVTVTIPASPDSPMFADGYSAQETVTGTYTCVGKALTFTDEGGNFDIGTVVDEETVMMHGFIASFAKMSGMTNITLTKTSAPVEPAKLLKSVSVDESITLNARKSADLNVIVEDSDVVYTLSYTSSDAKIASVDDNGKVTARHRGTATITVTAMDENGNTVSADCAVKVKYTWWQWIIVVLFFGWIWY